MKLLEIKNNLAKISYQTEEALSLGSFVALVDAGLSYIAQIVNLKADIRTNYAIAKLMFTFSNEGIVNNYDGTIPSMQAELSFINTKDILALLPMEKPVALGELAQQNEMLYVDQTFYEKNLVICAEKFENINITVKNAVSQLEQINEKSVVIDTDHTFGEFEPIKFKRNFKLPLNSRMIDFIYENDLSEVDATSKAVIQDIFYEVQQYTKTVEGNYIPFDTFLNVVSQQYETTLMPELALLKNKLLKYQEANVFAQNKEDLDSLKAAIEKHAITYIDISDETDELQKELISYIHNVINSCENYIYLFVKLTNKTGDKKILKQLVETEHVFTNIICSHGYKYLAELKQRAENLILFAPQTVQHDFASYNTFLSKLNANEFIAYGSLTQNVPFIVEQSELDEDVTPVAPQTNYAEITETKVTEEVIVPVEEPTEIVTEQVQNEPIFEEQNAPENIFAASSFQATPIFEVPAEFEDVQELENEIIQQEPEISEHDILVEQVAKDVDEILYSNVVEEIPSIDEFAPQEEVLTENDLDFIDEFPQAEYTNEEAMIIETPDNFIEQPAEFAEDFQYQEQPVFEESYAEEEPFITEDNFIEESIIETQNEDFSSTQEFMENENLQDDFNFIEDEIEDEFQEPEIPVYPADAPTLSNDVIGFAQGDMVSHPKYGRGVIEKLIKYGNKTLCSISFENVGRRLLDPAISELEKI